MADYIVTGANGFIGAHLVKELLKDPEHRVLALVRKDANCWRLSHRDRLIVRNVQFNDYRQLVAAAHDFESKAIFHLAWEGVRNHYRNDPIQGNNFLVFQHLLRLAQEKKIEMVIGIGSQAEYGIKNYPIHEDECLKPITLYGREKVKACNYMQDFCSKYNIRHLWFRIFSAYGPMDNTEWLIPYVIQALLAGREPLLTQGSQVWDYLYVEDVAKALFFSSTQKHTGVFNLGSGIPVSIRQVVTTIYELLNQKHTIPFGTLPLREGQVMHLQANMVKFFSFYQWRPKISLKEGLVRTIQFYQNDAHLN
jgi:UDP-glucose 4-epimerase